MVKEEQIKNLDEAIETMADGVSKITDGFFYLAEIFSDCIQEPVEEVTGHEFTEEDIEHIKEEIPQRLLERLLEEAESIEDPKAREKFMMGISIGMEAYDMTPEPPGPEDDISVR